MPVVQVPGIPSYARGRAGDKPANQLKLAVARRRHITSFAVMAGLSSERRGAFASVQRSPSGAQPKTREQDQRCLCLLLNWGTLGVFERLCGSVMTAWRKRFSRDHEWLNGTRRLPRLLSRQSPSIGR